VLLGPAFFLSPGLLQKVYGADSARTVRRGVCASAVALLAFAAVPALCGVIARVRFPDLADSQLALPTLLVHGVPPIVGGLGLAAIFSAEISTCDAILFMLATSLSQDLYRRFWNPSASERTLLRVARLSAVAGGSAAVAVAILNPTILGTLRVFYALIGVCLLVPVIAGLHAPRARTVHAAAAIGAGVVVTLAIWVGTPTRTAGGLTADNWGMLASVAAYLIARLASARRSAGAATG
jgi:SSS family solute:Na+ symporter